MWNTIWCVCNESSQAFIICNTFYDVYPDAKTGLGFYISHMKVVIFHQHISDLIKKLIEAYQTPRINNQEIYSIAGWTETWENPEINFL